MLEGMGNGKSNNNKREPVYTCQVGGVLGSRAHACTLSLTARVDSQPDSHGERGSFIVACVRNASAHGDDKGSNRGRWISVPFDSSLIHLATWIGSAWGYTVGSTVTRFPCTMRGSGIRGMLDAAASASGVIVDACAGDGTAGDAVSARIMYRYDNGNRSDGSGSSIIVDGERYYPVVFRFTCDDATRGAVPVEWGERVTGLRHGDGEYRVLANHGFTRFVAEHRGFGDIVKNNMTRNYKCLGSRWLNELNVIVGSFDYGGLLREVGDWWTYLQKNQESLLARLIHAGLVGLSGVFADDHDTDCSQDCEHDCAHIPVVANSNARTVNTGTLDSSTVAHRLPLRVAWEEVLLRYTVLGDSPLPARCESRVVFDPARGEYTVSMLLSRGMLDYRRNRESVDACSAVLFTL